VRVLNTQPLKFSTWKENVCCRNWPAIKLKTIFNFHCQPGSMFFHC